MTCEHITYLGKKFRIRPASEADHIAKSIRATSAFYEMELLSYLRIFGLRGRYAIDVGANIGNHSIFFSAFMADQVISIEANNSIVPILKENLAENNCRHKVIPTAVGSEPGVGAISFPLENNVGAGKITKGDGGINILTLDQISPSQRVFLVKIDVEGMELEVLYGARKLLKENHPDLVIEAQTAVEFRAIDDFLRPLGYRCLSTWNSTPTYHFSCKNGVPTRLRVAVIRIYVKTYALMRRVARSLFRGRWVRTPHRNTQTKLYK